MNLIQSTLWTSIASDTSTVDTTSDKDKSAQWVAIVQRRLTNQAKRINQGIISGELTATEAQILNTQQAVIQQVLTTDLSNGLLTKAEYMSLKTLLDEASKDIYSAKHNLDQNGAPLNSPAKTQDPTATPAPTPLPTPVPPPPAPAPCTSLFC